MDNTTSDNLFCPRPDDGNGDALAGDPAHGPDDGRPDDPNLATEPRRPRRWRRPAAAGAAALALMVGAGTAGAGLATAFDSAPPASATDHASAASASITPASSRAPAKPLAKVAATVRPSVAAITVTAGQSSDEGSGVILDRAGTILTNNHVVAPAAGGGSITVRLANGRQHDASIVGRDPSTDLAVIRVHGAGSVTPATLGNSDSLHVGDPVLAIGSPLGLDGSVTSGIISARNRTITAGDSSGSDGSGGSGSPFDQSGAPSRPTVIDAIQTDAAINPGNSGGPLVDDAGRVIGINSAIASLGTSGGGQGGNIGVGFAIPINEAKSVADQLIKTGHVRHALLGVSITDASGSTPGALVRQVVSGGPAATAGLRSGDVITRLGGRSVDGADALSAAVRAHRAGQRVRLHYQRGGEAKTTTVTLGDASSSG
jgi:putative serine protease PepD